VVVVVNKVDRSDARAKEVVDEIYELFFDLDAGDHQIEFPIVSSIAREGIAINGIGIPSESDTLAPILEAIVDTIPAPMGDPSAPLQALVTSLDASDYLGRLAVGRVIEGTMTAGEQVVLLQEEGSDPIKRKLGQLMGFEDLDRTDVTERTAGDLFVVAGFPEVQIGDTFADGETPMALPRLEVDEPVLRMTFGVNTSPLAGTEGTFVTSRQIRERLDREVLGNVSIQIGETSSPEVIEVAGRGELQLAVLIESMRREGFELQVSRPEVIVKVIDGVDHEPVETVTVDVPDEYVGAVTQAVAPRKGRIEQLLPGENGRTILTFNAPSRGLLGLRTHLLTITRGTALVNMRHEGWIPWVGELPHRHGGAMVADRRGTSSGFALDNLQKRGELFIEPVVEVYEGMVIGEASRPENMVVNPTKGKQLTNIRTHSTDEAIKLKPPRDMGLEPAIEWIAADELVEVTPKSIRIRKKLLTEADRKRAKQK
jgi:GTP-binding protein